MFLKVKTSKKLKRGKMEDMFEFKEDEDSLAQDIDSLNLDD